MRKGSSNRCANATRYFSDAYSFSYPPRTQEKPIQLAERCKARVCGQSLVGNARSNPAGRKDVCAACCQVEVSATLRFLVQRSPADCGVYDIETSRMRRPWTSLGCCTKYKKPLNGVEIQRLKLCMKFPHLFYIDI